MHVESMVNCKMSGQQHDSVEVESLLMGPCWNQSTSVTDQYLLDGHKLLLEADLDSLPSDGETQKSSMDVLENLLLSSTGGGGGPGGPTITTSNSNGHGNGGPGGGPGGGGTGGGGGGGLGGDLKPLPSFTSFNTGHLSINGISGYHYTAIAQRLPEENNNYAQNSYSQGSASGGAVTPSGGSTGSGSATSAGSDNNIVSSTSTCLPDSVLNPAEVDGGAGVSHCHSLQNVKLFADGSIDDGGGGGGGGGGGKIFSAPADSCAMTGPDSVSGARIFVDTKELSEYDMSSIEDIAAIIGSAIADTTVPSSKVEKEDGNDTRDSWMDLDAWIEGTCTGVPDAKLIVSQQDSLSELILPHSPVCSHGTGPNGTSSTTTTTTTSTLQSLLTHGYMPLLQNRLQNGPPVKLEAPSSTSAYLGGDLISTSTSPPGSVVSTSTDHSLILNGRYLQQTTTHQPPPHHHHHQHHQQHQQHHGGGGGLHHGHHHQNPHNHHNNHHHHNHHNNNNHHQHAGGFGGLGTAIGQKPDGLCSPELPGGPLGNFPHTTTNNSSNNNSNSNSTSNANGHASSSASNSSSSSTSSSSSSSSSSASNSPTTPKSKRRGHGTKQQQQQKLQHGLVGQQQGGPTLHAQHQQQQQQHHQQQQQQLSAQSQQAAALSFQAANDLSGLLGKEKPVHRCNICNRGFLNKSNIKVHLRTHTGEKPFRCEVCAKAFRQKAHLIKHQQIHKRIGRD